MPGYMLGASCAITLDRAISSFTGNPNEYAMF
jgi:hypothetical protein